MSSKWLENEWKDLCQRVERCAEVHEGQSSSIEQHAQDFCQQAPPSDYFTLLEKVGDAAKLAVTWQGKEPTMKVQRQPFDPAHGVVDSVDEAGAESFPASDPPAYSR